MDSNFVPSPTLYPILKKDSTFNIIESLSPKYHVFVIPAFKSLSVAIEDDYPSDENSSFEGPSSQEQEEEESHSELPQNKEELKQAFEQKTVTILGEKDPTQTFTNVHRWFEGNNLYYTRWGRSYEPFIIFNKTTTSSPRFRLEATTSSSVREMFALESSLRGHRFVVLGEAYLIQIRESSELEIEDYWKYIDWVGEVEQELRYKYRCPHNKKFCNQAPEDERIEPL